VNGGLGRSEGRRVKPSSRASSERYAASRAHRCEAGEDRRKAQGGERSSSSGSRIGQKRCVGRGTGAVKATGSCEEPLPAEGTLDHQAASAFTGRRWRWSRRTPHHSTRANPSKEDARPTCSSREGERGEGRMGFATGVSEARSHRRRGKKTPTLVPGREARTRVQALDDDPPKRSSDGVNHPVPRYYRAEPKTPWGVPAAKVARASREHARCGCTQFVWVADIGWTHRASSPPGGRKTCWWAERALARRKSVAPYDAGRGWREGETVRVRGNSHKVSPRTASRFRLAGSQHDRRRSRAFARRTLTGQAQQGPLTRRSTPSPSARSVSGQHIGRRSDFDSGVPAGDKGTSEVDTIR
jgi:hypothetical protein